ncbi:hypothetical protein BO94DRAFT_599308 [Aspergillus sclerotioniger CBS 115572]|uniref:MYND-type domain-containing protein n=1 Tax=Aspergillus sclerotioniger CBS 115572 TaxID=1450535 RepID=A0A317WBX4_9EURO|nr:hypothetical protein BO94DRAFT_599308 [Aspergillus sclerotioniger CBS 115572]PWY83853.1 hypothetical protein BO94DRAFT_599308 [Aspergillus sclerotioniger CBS 115572]
MSPPSGTCANCSKPTHLQCAACKDAPEHTPGDASRTFYCSRDCQKAHRPAHKDHCKTMLHRKKLLRTAIILKAAFLGYREIEFDVELSKIEQRGRFLYLSDNQKNLNIPPKRGPFPEHLTTNPEHREAALTWFQCLAACCLSSRLMKKLLAGIPCEIDLLALQIGKRRFTTQVIPGPDSPNVPSLDATTTPHVVFRVNVRLSSGDGMWIVDLTGAQYSFKGVLFSYDQYMREKRCRLEDTDPCPLNETWDLDVVSTMMNSIQQDIMHAERPSRLHFADLVGIVGKEVLDGSPDEFKDKLVWFRTTLKLHMLSRYKHA